MCSTACASVQTFAGKVRQQDKRQIESEMAIWNKNDEWNCVAIQRNRGKLKQAGNFQTGHPGDAAREIFHLARQLIVHAP